MKSIKRDFFITSFFANIEFNIRFAAGVVYIYRYMCAYIHILNNKTVILVFMLLNT